MAAKHNLKIWPEYFKAVKEGRKTFELRKADRPFAVGDTLVLQEWDPATQEYTGDSVEVQITYILPGGSFGLDSDYCILGFLPPGFRLVKEVPTFLEFVTTMMRVLGTAKRCCLPRTFCCTCASRSDCQEHSAGSAPAVLLPAVHCTSSMVQ